MYKVDETLGWRIGERDLGIKSKEKIKLGISDVKQLLPQRFPFLMIDEVLEYQIGVGLTATKLVSQDEDFFQYATKAMPDIMSLEMIAQAASLLAILTKKRVNDGNQDDFYLLGVNNAHFQGEVSPGQELIIKVNQIYAKNGIWRFHGIVNSDHGEIAKADVIGAQVKRP